MLPRGGAQLPYVGKLVLFGKVKFFPCLGDKSKKERQSVKGGAKADINTMNFLLGDKSG